MQIVDQSFRTTEKDTLSKIIDLIHDEFAFDGYLDDGVEDINMGETCASTFLKIFWCFFNMRDFKNFVSML